MSEQRNLKDDVEINRFQLDIECQQHASIYRYWSEELAAAKAASDQRVDQLKLITARTLAESRKRLEAAGAKATESAVSAETEASPEVLDAKEYLRQTQATVYHLQAAVSSMEHRKSQLDNLVYLWGKNYYSNPDGGPRPTPSDDAGLRARQQLNRNRNQEEPANG